MDSGAVAELRFRSWARYAFARTRGGRRDEATKREQHEGESDCADVAELAETLRLAL